MKRHKYIECFRSDQIIAIIPSVMYIPKGHRIKGIRQVWIDFLVFHISIGKVWEEDA